MTAIQFVRFGPATDVAELLEVAEPDPPGADEVLIEVLVHDRMPVILSREGVSDWLSAPDASLLRPAPEDALQMWRVDPKVNSNRYQEADGIKPILGRT